MNHINYWLKITSSRQADANLIPLDEGKWKIDFEGRYYLDKTVSAFELCDAIYEAADVDEENGTEEDGTHYGKVLDVLEPIFSRTAESINATIDGISYEFTLARCKD